MKYFIITLFLISFAGFIIPQAFGAGENFFYGTAIFERLPTTIVPNNPTEFEIKFHYTAGSYALENLTPVIEVSPEGAKPKVHFDVEPVSAYQNDIVRMPVTITVEPDIEYEKIFLSISYAGIGLHDVSFRSSWSDSIIFDIDHDVVNESILLPNNKEKIIPSPLKQFKSGIPAKYVNCKEGHQLIIKSSTGTPACLDWENGKKLLGQGWAKSAPMISNSVCDLNCKIKLESQDYTCYEAAKNSNFCTNKKSQKMSEITIPYSAGSPNGKNYIPNPLTISIGVNNTVIWTNVDITSHTVVGDKEEFRSPLILPNQTWTFTFDKIGEYGYHGEPGPWLRGTVTVLPIDMNFDKGKPIENWGGEPFLGRYIFRDTDSLGYVNKVSVIDDNSALVSLSYPNGTEKKKIELGEEFIGSCSKYNEFTTVRTFVLERIDNEQKNTQFREELEQINKNCNEVFREN